MSKQELFDLAQSKIQKPSQISIQQTFDGIQLNYQNHTVANIDTHGNLSNYDPSEVMYEYPRTVQGEIRNVITNLVLTIKYQK